MRWYDLFNLTEFLNTNLVSQEIDITLVGIGSKTILVTRGINTCITYDDLFFSLGLSNPFFLDDTHAVYVDTANEVWLGLPA